MFRAPGFSIKPSCFWAYPIMRRHGVMVDVSIVPAPRAHGGIDAFARDPFLLHTNEGTIKVFPMSIMTALGTAGSVFRWWLSSTVLHADHPLRIPSKPSGRPPGNDIHPSARGQPATASPATAETKKLQVLREHGHHRRQAARHAEELPLWNRCRRSGAHQRVRRIRDGGRRYCAHARSCSGSLKACSKALADR